MSGARPPHPPTATTGYCRVVEGTHRFFLPLFGDTMEATGYRPYDGTRPKEPADLILKPDAEGLGLECVGYWPNADRFHALTLTPVGPRTVDGADVLYIRRSRSADPLVRACFQYDEWEAANLSPEATRAALLGSPAPPGPMTPAVFYMEALNLLLNVAMCVAVVYLWRALRGNLTVLGDAGRKVRVLIEKSEGLVAENEALAARHRAAEADAHTARLRYLEAMEDKRQNPPCDE